MKMKIEIASGMGLILHGKFAQKKETHSDRLQRKEVVIKVRAKRSNQK